MTLALRYAVRSDVGLLREGNEDSAYAGPHLLAVADGMGLDHRIGPHFLQAGIGYGGSCFPKDVQALKQLAGNSGYHFQLLTAVIEVNELQKRRVISKLQKHLGTLVGKTVTLLGLANAYGGIGGGFHTLQMTMNLPAGVVT